MLDKEKLNDCLDKHKSLIVNNSEKLDEISKSDLIESDEISNLPFLERREYYKNNKLL